MILSASRRTDIPNYYSEWFCNRIRERYLYVRNPMNLRQISRITLTSDAIDCIVFWTKNPEPMLDRLGELKGYPYYFQFTLTGYGRDIEPGVPHKKDHMIRIFQRLSETIGSNRVIWRYDPILFTDTYTPEYHLRAIEQISSALKGYTETCVISFVDIYAKIRKNIAGLNVYELTQQNLFEFSKKLSDLVRVNGIAAASCAEAVDLSEYGIKHNCCIDSKLIEKITGYPLSIRKDRNQRAECGCAESIDIGTYNTCRNGCLYFYANYSKESVLKNSSLYDPNSPLLCGIVKPEDIITERRLKNTGFSVG